MVRRLIHGSSTGPYGRREKIQSRRSVLEYMLRLAFVYLAGAAPFIGSSGDLSGDLVNGKHAAYRSANAASASWRF